MCSILSHCRPCWIFGDSSGSSDDGEQVMTVTMMTCRNAAWRFDD